jgi:hypothetical protein
MFSSELQGQNTDIVCAISNRKELYSPVVLTVGLPDVDLIGYHTVWHNHS